VSRPHGRPGNWPFLSRLAEMDNAELALAGL